MSKSPQPLDWNHVRAFLCTAETGSLSAAARKLGLTQPTLSRQVAALEQDLGVLLFERLGRRLELTQAGAELLDHTRAMSEAAERITVTASGQSQSIDGRVSITASDVFSALLLPPLLKDLRDIAPNLEIEIVASNDLRDLMRREADIAIRHVRPQQPDLIARLVHEATAHFYASPAYLDRRGRPADLADLVDHDFISFGNTDRMLEHYLPMGLPVGARNFPIGSENGIVSWELAKQGFGILPMSDEVAQNCPEMERILPDLAPVTFPIWLCTHRELHTSRRIRLVYDLLATALAR